MKYDVVVVGGGPAGSVAAHVLASAGRKILRVDMLSAKLSRKVGESLPGAARPLLQHLNLLEMVERGPHLATVGNSSAWGSSELTTTDMIRDPNGPGWHLDRARFDADLRATAQSIGVDFRFARVQNINRTGTGWDILLNDESVEAKWIIDASGRAALIARSFGAIRSRDDDLMAVVAWSKSENSDRRTVIESTTNGWWYTAGLPEDTRVVVFHCGAQAAGALAKSPTLFEKTLRATQHVRRFVENFEPMERLQCREAAGARLDKFVGDGWLAAGDAALSFEPLSSQGIFNALYSGMKAGRAIHQSLQGNHLALAEYSERLEKIRAAYVSHRYLYYSLETRWLAEPFWQVRTQSSILSAVSSGP